jgi:hypothetical protein
MQVNKSLNMMNNMSMIGTPAAARTGPSTYESAIPRVAFGLAGIAMTAITIALSVILPAKLDSGRGEPLVSLASQASAPASDGVYAIASITVVAAREPKSSTGRQRIGEAAPNAEQSGETNSSAILRVSSAAR